MPLILILVECGIELIPKHIRNHPSVKTNFPSKNYHSQLLDNALHHSAIAKLKNPEKRGRPDITHICLLNALGSPLNKEGYLKLYIHTINDRIFEFNPQIRMARNFNRFKGLMAKMLIDGKIQAQTTTLISPFEGNLKTFIQSFNEPNITLLSSKGNLTKTPEELFLGDISVNSICVIGGFQKGNFSQEIFNLSRNIRSISNHSLDAGNALSKLINSYEFKHKII